MEVATSTPLLTPDDLSNMRDSVRFELVDGKLVARHLGAESSAIAFRIAFLIGLYLRQRRLGLLFGSDASYLCFPNAPKTVRRADVGFVRFDRLPGGKAPKSHCRVSPDLVVEVISPNDTAEEVETKVMEWLSAGVPLVWVVSPGARNVRIHRPRNASLGAISILTVEDSISGEEVLPGFFCGVGEFFENI